MKNIAYRQGMAAFFAGQSIDANPYTVVEIAEYFDLGFEDARIEFEANHADLNDEEPRRILSDSAWALS